jgi:ADP-ribose pyrophosphatase YjhB (NUDIX family)
MKFCSACGSDKVVFEIPEGDNRRRFICRECGAIHYKNPLVVCGTVPIWNDQVLLCRRAIEPRLGYWTLPAGFMENGESVPEGAARETQEESLAALKSPQLLTLLSVPAINQVHAMFWSELVSPDFGVTPESTEVALFSRAQIPWGELAFLTVKRTLEHFFECKDNGKYTVLVETIQR